MVGEGRENRLALGAAIGTPAVAINACANAGAIGGYAIGHTGALGQYQCQCPRHEGVGQLLNQGFDAGEIGIARNVAPMGDMQNERITVRPLFGLEDAVDRYWIESVGAETVDSFSRKRHQAAALDDRCGARYPALVGMRRSELDQLSGHRGGSVPRCPLCVTRSRRVVGYGCQLRRSRFQFGLRVRGSISPNSGYQSFLLSRDSL